ncbi:hypothetical protein GA0074696_0200 [Micromonospora purpureochromogenes]|uniref:Uncharacterized protein n=1 Tax=Micromonospora purpureochromogenes TaxID=47872 RepID=A0A1C4U8Y9_9ACTN|nr:hypothetical protein [Micromonospora purpureochromogenes]SCE68180.1 hypothetical protein GA0074696_0200 [Micromonospora purpureochromogenes]
MHNQPGGAPPVFVDRTGKRRRLMTIAGTAMGLGLLTSIGLVLAGLFGDSTVPLPGWTDPRARPPIEAGVDTPEDLSQPGSPAASSQPSPVTSTAAPTPTGTAGPSVTTTARPGPQPSTSVPGQGDVRRTAKPSRSPGRPH